MLQASDDATVAWRIIAAHHPLYTVGEHAGYQQWVRRPDGKAYVKKLDLCSRETAPFDWLANSLDPEDECTCEWVSYRRRVLSAIQESGKRVHLVLGGHDHSLQLLYYPERDAACAACPRVHVVSGAGSRMTRTKLPTLDDQRAEYEFTATGEARQGRSRSGFVRLTLGLDTIRLDFHDGAAEIPPEEMSGGARAAAFCVDREGRLVECADEDGNTAERRAE
jgi:cytochrome c553